MRVVEGDRWNRSSRPKAAAEAAQDICNAYGEGVTGESTARKWFSNFKNDDFDDDTPRNGRLSEFDEERLKALLKEDDHQTSHKLAEKRNCDHKLNNFHSMRFAKNLRAWESHELNKSNKENRLQIASQHLASHRLTHGHKQRFLYRIVTEDEKWCLYKNIYQRKEWVFPTDTPKPRVKHDLHPKKTMICVWWEWESMVQLGNTRKECHGQQGALHISQVHRMKEAIRLRSHIDKRYHSDGKHFIDHIVLQGKKLGFTISTPQTKKQPWRGNTLDHQRKRNLRLHPLPVGNLESPPYSPDLAPNDYMLFPRLKEHLAGRWLSSGSAVKTSAETSLNGQGPDFYQDG
ncbi:histone-lysine N-methyltransferase SETMAR [Trichonephila clavipes]|uniref:Histone-lysine N-methyltransferase SETMAR n=1 Tax=Trichonephila clavipes TaxID=2585209 RepID=A0A8X6RRQ5_TRICX|nr:histone-lysine N-methyltransferase SETMAR [Trichonephila clavipes]